MSLDLETIPQANDFESRYGLPGARRAVSYEQRVVMGLLGDLRPGVLLDVGTGAGRLVNFPPPPEVIGVDPSPKELAWAKQRYLGDSSKHFVLASPDDLPFRDEAFDFVTCIRVIKYLQDPESAVAEMADALKPGGRLVVDISNKFAPAAILRRIASWSRLHAPCRAYFSHGDGLRMMASVGLIPFSSRPLFKIDPVVWKALGSDWLAGKVEKLERFLDGRTGVWFLSRYVAIACEKPFTPPDEAEG